MPANSSAIALAAPLAIAPLPATTAAAAIAARPTPTPTPTRRADGWRQGGPRGDAHGGDAYEGDMHGHIGSGYRYSDRDPYRDAIRPVPLRRLVRRHVPAPTAPPCSAPEAVNRILGLRPGQQHPTDMDNFIAMLRYAGETALFREIGIAKAAEWLARRDGIAVPQAMQKLHRTTQVLRTVFFDTPPDRRPAMWDALEPAGRADVNRLVALTDAANAARAASPEATDVCSSDRQLEVRVHAAAAEAMQRPRTTDMPSSETPYRMALAQFLREHDAPVHAFFRHRLEVLPGDIRRFIARICRKLPAPPPSPSPAPSGLHGVDYPRQRRYDLEAVLYPLWCNDSCDTRMTATPSLAAMREHFDAALVKQGYEAVFIDKMFVAPAPGATAAAGAVAFHDGLSMRNARGKQVADLILELDRHLKGFAALDRNRKARLVRRRLNDLQESVDYPFGSVRQSMATMLMRTSSRPKANRYVRYGTYHALLEAWEAGHLQWLNRRDLAVSPKLLGAMHLAAGNGVAISDIAWYRNMWENRIVAPLAESPAIRQAGHDRRQEVWQWLQSHAPDWRADSQRWEPVPPERYAQQVTQVLDLFYQLRSATQYPVFTLIDAVSGSSTFEYHPLLQDLSPPMRAAVADVARQFDAAPLYRERILFDNWIATSFRLLDYAHAAGAVLNPPPSYCVEIQAYTALRNAGLSHLQTTENTAAILPPHGDPAAGSSPARRQPAYAAFLSIIADWPGETELLLPDDQRIMPHAIVDRALADYRVGLPRHAAIVGRARQALRSQGLPLLPSLLQAEIDAIAAPLQKAAGQASQSGTVSVDAFFSALQTEEPLQSIGHAVRFNRAGHVPYPALVLARDFAAITSLGRRFRAGPAGLTEAGALTDTPAYAAGAGALLRPRMERYDPERRYAPWPAMTAAAARSVLPADSTAEGLQRMQRMLAPSQDRTDLRQRHLVAELGRRTVRALKRIALADTGHAGTHGDFIGLGGVDAHTRCNGEPLGARPTVTATVDWMLKAQNADLRDPLQLIARHMNVSVSPAAQRLWRDRPDLRYDPVRIATETYRGAAGFRKLFNWYDDHAIDSASIRLAIEADDRPDAVSRVPDSTAVTIVLPADPASLPLVMTERGIAPQTMFQAAVERLIAALTRAAPPHASRAPLERGLAIRLANDIRQQTGMAFEPRINAAIYADPGAQGEPGRASEIAELEDQYLERILPNDPLSGGRGMYQGGALARRPTVKAVIAALTRLDYRNALKAAPTATGSDAAARRDFLHRFGRRFDIDAGNGAAERKHAVEAFLFDCHVGSSLFRALLAYGMPRMTMRWTILTEGHADDSDRLDHALLPAPGIVNARSKDAVYLGLIETDPVAGETYTLPRPSLQPVAPNRRLLDGIVAVLNDDPSTMPLHETRAHRGATVWLSDTILWQSGWPAAKRLAAIAASDSASAGRAQLAALAGRNRRAARAEDIYIARWLET